MTEEKQIEPPRILIGIMNNNRYIPTYFFNSTMNLMNFSRKFFKIDIMNISAYDIALMRNICCDTAIKNGYDFVFMLDVDMEYPADSILKLFQRWGKFETPYNIVVGSARKRAPPFQYCQFKQLEVPNFSDDSNRVVPDRSSNELVKIEGTGLVGALIPTVVLKKLPSPYFETIYKEGGHYTGEDINMCFKCKEAGVSIWLDPQVTYGHEVIRMIDADGERMANQ
jgi:hypothetical protein